VTFTVGSATPSDDSIDLPASYRNLMLYTQDKCPGSPNIVYTECSISMTSSLTVTSTTDGTASVESMLGDSLGTEYQVEVSSNVIAKSADNNNPMTLYLSTTGSWNTGVYVAPYLKANLYKTVSAHDTTGNSTMDGAKVGTELASPLKVEVVLGLPDYTLGTKSLQGTGTFKTTKVPNATLIATLTSGHANAPVITSENNGLYDISIKMGADPEKNTITIDGSAQVIVPHITEADQFVEETVTLGIGHDICFKYSGKDTGIRCDYGDMQEQRQETEPPTRDVYSVLPEVTAPGLLLVGDDNKLVQDVIIFYSIKPSDYIAGSAYLLIYEDNELYSYAIVNFSGSGTQTLLRGTTFDFSKKYEAELVLNYADTMEMKSKKVDMPVGKMYIETADSEFPDVKLKWDDYYPALGSKAITLKTSSSFNGQTVNCDIVEPTAETMASIGSMTMPTCSSENSSITGNTIKFKLTGADLAPMTNNDAATGVNNIKLRFTVSPSSTTVDAIYQVKNNSNTTMKEVLAGEGVFTADKDTVVSTSTGTTTDAQGFDYVQELLNQVVPRMRQTYDDTATPPAWVPNQYGLLQVNGIYSDASYIGVMQFKRSFGLSADASDTYKKIKKDYGLNVTDANNWEWFHKIIDKEALIGKTKRIPADTEIITTTNADTVPNTAAGSTQSDTGLYELYKNVVERFVNKMIAEGDLYRQSRGSDYPVLQTNTSWRARTGDTVTESESYCFGCKDKYEDFWRTVTTRRACSPNVTDDYPTCSVSFGGSGCDAVNNGYAGNVNDGTGAYAGSKQYPGLKQDEYNLWDDLQSEDATDIQDCNGDARFNPLNWAGIDCSGFVQRLTNYAEYDQGTMTTAWGINTNIGDIRTTLTLTGVIAAASFFTTERVSFWDNPDTTANQAILQRKLKKGDLVRYGNTHISMIYSDAPTCDDSVCTYDIVHASGNERICYGLPGEPETCTGFNRKVTTNSISNSIKGLFRNPTGFGRIKLWD